MNANQGWIYREQVATNDISLLDYYATRYPHSSRQEWLDRIQSGLISVDHVPVTNAELKLQSGQFLAYHRPPWIEPTVPFNVSVLYEDDCLLMLDKPAGLPVLPGGGFLENTLWSWLRQHYDNPPTPMHRLGRGTSGLMLLAKTQAAKSALSQAFRTHQIEKTYRALATRTDQPETFTVTHAIGKVPHSTLGYLYAATENGKTAISYCRVLQRNRIPNATLLEVTIPTGRPHQIRIHLAAAGYPLLNDPLYGVGGGILESAVPGDCGYHLHAHQMSLIHPTQKRQLTVSANLPALLECNT